MYAIITTEGEVQERDGIPHLEELQAAVGGIIEVVSLPDYDLFINEEGKYADDGRSLPRNAVACKLTAGRLFAGDYIAGVAVAVGSPDRKGESTSLPAKALDRIHVAAGHAPPVTT